MTAFSSQNHISKLESSRKSRLLFWHNFPFLTLMMEKEKVNITGIQVRLSLFSWECRFLSSHPTGPLPWHECGLGAQVGRELLTQCDGHEGWCWCWKFCLHHSWGKMKMRNPPPPCFSKVVSHSPSWSRVNSSHISASGGWNHKYVPLQPTVINLLMGILPRTMLKWELQKKCLTTSDHCCFLSLKS